MQARICGWKTSTNFWGTALQYKAWDSHSWGNLLSEYWEARGLAALSGKAFECTGPFGHGFLRYLPTRYPAQHKMQDRAKVQAACAACKRMRMFPHACAGAWTHIRGLIQKDTQAALAKFDEGLATGQQAAKDAGATQPLAHPGLVTKASNVPAGGEHVLVHMRLEFVANQQQWPSKQVFMTHMPKGTSLVTILHQPYLPEQVKGAAKRGHVHNTFKDWEIRNITALLKGYRDILGGVCGGCTVRLETGSQTEDFARIAQHNGPIFGSGSSFMLWAGLANEHGPVFFPDFFTSHAPPVLGGSGGKWVYTHGPFLPNTEVQNFAGKTGEQIVAWANGGDAPRPPQR